MRALKPNDELRPEPTELGKLVFEVGPLRVGDDTQGAGVEHAPW
jgi:hypothetical protein